MYKFALLIMILGLSVTAFAQTDVKPEKKKATDADKIATFDADGEIKRGAKIGDSKIVKLEDVLANPKKFEGKTVRVNGYVVRSCKKEGCWAELGAAKDSNKSVRVTMKDHQFFIPLKSAGFKAVAEGTFRIKTLDAKHVKHLIEDDGAKFDKINEDGTVTEVAFVASGIVLSKK